MGRRGPLPSPRDAHGEILDPVTAVAVIEHQQEVADQGTRMVDVPRPPDGILVESRRTWESFWFSRAATRVDRASQLQRLKRWIRDVDMATRIRRDLQPKAGDGGKNPTPGVPYPSRPWLGRGSTNQITRHPQAEELDKLEARLHRTEVEFGMTPYSEVRLGLAGVQGALTAEQLRKMLDERRKHAGDGNDDDDWAAGYTR